MKLIERIGKCRAEDAGQREKSKPPSFGIGDDIALISVVIAASGPPTALSLTGSGALSYLRRKEDPRRPPKPVGSPVSARVVAMKKANPPTRG